MKLVEYMPPYLKNVIEFNKIFDAEDVEIESMRYLIDKILKEVIVKTATSYGLKKYETIYNITKKEETIEARRMTILLKMDNKVPYTLKSLCLKLNVLCGKNFNVEIEGYRIKITTHLQDVGRVKELESLLNYMVPCNMVIESNNDISIEIKQNSKLASNVMLYSIIEITC